MTMTTLLNSINAVPSAQDRLALYAKHGLKEWATNLIHRSVQNGTAFFYFDWHNPDRVCAPLPRCKGTIKRGDGVFLVCHKGSKFETFQNHAKNEGLDQIAFELGWEKEALDWTPDMRLDLIRIVGNQALARPLSQWTLRQAEGTIQAVRQLLPTQDALARDLSAQHIVFHLREADFGRMPMYLTRSHNCADKLEPDVLVRWVVSELRSLGWDESRIRKELAEWMHLKDGTWPESMLAVAQHELFTNFPDMRRQALRRYCAKILEFWLKDRRQTTFLLELARLGLFDHHDQPRFEERVLECLGAGEVTNSDQIVRDYGPVIWRQEPAEAAALLKRLAEQAIHNAVTNGQFSVAVALSKRFKLKPNAHWNAMADTLEQSTTLK